MALTTLTLAVAYSSDAWWEKNAHYPISTVAILLNKYTVIAVSWGVFILSFTKSKESMNRYLFVFDSS